MIRITLFIRTKRGFRKVCIRGYSRSMPLLVDAKDGRNIDRSADIANAFNDDKKLMQLIKLKKYH